MLPGLELLLYLAIFLVTFVPWAIWRLRKPVDVRLRSAARYRGLRMQRGMVSDTAEGTIDGLGVHVRYTDTQSPRQRDQPWGPPSASCRVAVTLPAPLPAGLRLSSMSVAQHVIQTLGGQDIEIGDEWLDSALRIRADRPAEAQRLLADRDVRAAMRRASLHAYDHLDVSPEQVVLTRSGVNVPDAGELIDLAVDIAAALQGAAGLVWDDLASQLGLAEAKTVSGGALLSGVREGVPVRLRFHTDEEGEAATHISASFSAPLPGALRLRRRRPGTPSPSTGNPILDMHVEMRAADEAHARALLASPALTGPLLELLSEVPDARIQPDGIKLSLPDWRLDTINELLGLIVELAGCFNAASAPGEARPVRQEQTLKG